VHTIKEEITPMLLRLFHKIQREGTLTNLFHEASITLLPTPNKGTTKKYLPISLMNIEAKFRYKIQTEFYHTLKRPCTMVNLVSFQGCKDGSIYSNQLR
jgi:hypothetical protein